MELTIKLQDIDEALAEQLPKIYVEIILTNF
jgi:hypothetical protein